MKIENDQDDKREKFLEAFRKVLSWKDKVADQVLADVSGLSRPSITNYRNKNWDCSMTLSAMIAILGFYGIDLGQMLADEVNQQTTKAAFPPEIQEFLDGYGAEMLSDAEWQSVFWLTRAGYFGGENKGGYGDVLDFLKDLKRRREGRK